jgi:hypothetical protein
MVGQLPLQKHDTTEKEKISEKPGGWQFWWLLLLIVEGITIVVQFKKENPELNLPGDEELFETLPEHAKETFKERYGRPNVDDRECELYYLLANTTMERPCVKCPVWCSEPEKIQVLVLKDQIYYIGKTCRQEGEREKEHTTMMTAFNLRYQWIKKGTEGYISTAEQLHLKTYYTRPEAVKEGCHLFLPPGNTVGMSLEDWRKLVKELK